MEISEFRKQAHRLVDWMADYLEGVRSYPVMSQVAPGEILSRLPAKPPPKPETFESIFDDFRKIVMPGITHWQHPSFFAYFPANSSPPSVLAEMLTAVLGTQCMIWQTSPAAAELEERMMDWLRQMIGLPDTFTGVIQDTASTATLCSLLTAREKATEYMINQRGFASSDRFSVYCSGETHSSIEKDVKIVGLGRESLRKVAANPAYAMKPEELDTAIRRDRQRGTTPLAVIATLGTTGSTAIDPLREIALVCRQHGVWLHVDAAYAGTALLLEEMRWMIEGVQTADTFVFNPHKWMFTNFDCSAYFVRDPQALVRTFEILPEYLKTSEGLAVKNYRDWGIQLGRRFRALKLWFVIRTYGVTGLKSLIRKHLDMATDLANWIEQSADFELLAPAPLCLVCFRYRPPGMTDPDTLNHLNQRLLEKANATGKLYLTHTKLSGIYSLRMVTAQTRVEHDDVRAAWDMIREVAASIDS